MFVWLVGEDEVLLVGAKQTQVVNCKTKSHHSFAFDAEAIVPASTGKFVHLPDERGKGYACRIVGVAVQSLFVL